MKRNYDVKEGGTPPC